MTERSARHEPAELTFDEAGKAATFAALGGLAQERFEVVADDVTEDGVPPARG